MPGPGLTLPPALQAVLKNLAEAVGGCYHCYSLDPEVSLLPLPAPRPPPAASVVHPGVGARTQPAAPHARWADTAQSEWTGVEIRGAQSRESPGQRA